MQADRQDAFQDTRGSDHEMSRILDRAFVIGMPAAFALTMAICLVAGIGWLPSALVAVWGGIVGGPFFGVSLLARQVSDLDGAATPISAPTATAAEPPDVRAA